MEVEKISEQKFILKGDLQLIRKSFQYEVQFRQFNYRTKKFDWKTGLDASYIALTQDGAIFQAGFAPYIYYHLNDHLSEEAKNILMDYTRGDVIHEFDGLRDTQPEDLALLLSFKRGIFSVFTGYGKTQVIAKLIEYIVKVRQEKVLVITPGSKPLDEVVLRVRDVAGLQPSYFDYDSLYNAININGFLRSNSYDPEHPYWKDVKWVIADECEYCLTDSSIAMLDRCVNIEHCYGFSGTADKSCADRITMRSGLSPQIQRNKNLVGHFGFSIVHRKPSGFDIDIIDIKTSMFNDLEDVRLTDDVTYSEVVKEIFINPRFCRGLKAIVEKEKQGIYIPMGRLEVIYYWLNNVFTWKNGCIVNICGDGIQVWSEGVKVKDINLDELKSMVENREVEVIVGTRSSYRAIDLPNLSKIIPLTSQVASNVLQQIGRVARKRRFQIFNLIPMIYVSCYTGDLRKRTQLINSYYEDCNINRIKRLESIYGIF